jgi:hypothetical protein
VGRVAADPPWLVGNPDGNVVAVGDEIPGGYMPLGVAAEPDVGVDVAVGWPWSLAGVEMPAIPADEESFSDGD